MRSDADDFSDEYKAKKIFEVFHSDDSGFWSQVNFQSWLDATSPGTSMSMDRFMAADWIYRTFVALCNSPVADVSEAILERGISEAQVIALYLDLGCQERLRQAQESVRSPDLKSIFNLDISKHYSLLSGAARCEGKAPDLQLRAPGRAAVLAGLRVTPAAIAKVKCKEEADYSGDDVALLLQALLEAYLAPEVQSSLRRAASDCGSTSVPEYFKFVQQESAIHQGPVFERFGLSPPPAGLRVLRRLTSRFEKEGHKDVCDLARQCRLALGVENGLLIETQCKRVPFFRQTDTGDCLQTNLRMVLKWFFPERDYSMQTLNERTGRSDSTKWTSTVQAIPFLLEEGLTAHLYTCESLDELLQRGEQYFFDHLGEELGELMVRKTDLPSLQHAIKRVRSNGSCSVQKLSEEEIDRVLADRTSVVILLVDYSRLFDPSVAKDAEYSGHFVTLIGAGPKHYLLHDSLGTPNKVVSKAQVMKAWEARGTDNDAIVISGRRSGPQAS